MTKYRLDRRDIQHLQSDGLGWGHDLEDGSFYLDAAPGRRDPGLAKRLRAALAGRRQR